MDPSKDVHLQGNMDDVLEAMKQDELEGLKKMTVGDYAKSRGIYPQIVHYYIRTGKIKPEWCDCGRKVISVETADEFFSQKKEVAGGVLDA